MSRFLVPSIAITMAVIFAPQSAAADLVPICGKSNPAGEQALATYKIVDGQKTDLAVGRRGSARLEIRLSPEGCLFEHRSKAPVRMVGFTHVFSSADAELTDQVRSFSQSTSRKNASAFIDVVKRTGVHPGKYSGTIEVDSEEAYGRTLSVPATVTFQDPRKWRVLLGPGILAAFLGTLIGWLKTAAAAKRKLRFKKWVSKKGNISAIILGCVAVVGVWVKEYLGDPTWGDTLQDWFALFSLMFAAMTAAVTTVTTATETVAARVADPADPLT
jgi:hypothetical protein